MESCEKSDVARVVIINKKSPYCGEIAPIIDRHLSWYRLNLLAGNFWFGKGEIKELQETESNVDICRR